MIVLQMQQEAIRNWQERFKAWSLYTANLNERLTQKLCQQHQAKRRLQQHNEMLWANLTKGMERDYARAYPDCTVAKESFQEFVAREYPGAV